MVNVGYQQANLINTIEKIGQSHSAEIYSKPMIEMDRK